MKPAIIYARFSWRPDPDKCMSIENQFDLCQAWCKARALDVNGTYRDAAISGKRADNRPGLQAAIEHVCRLKGVLVVLDLNRLARSIWDAINISAQLKKSKSELAIISMGIDTSTAGGRMFYHIMAAVGQFQRESMANRTSEALLSMQARGMRISRTPRYGYALDPKDPKRVIRDEREQRTIRIIVQRRRAGMGYRQICGNDF